LIKIKNIKYYLLKFKLLIGVLSLLYSLSANAQGYTEHELKAGYLYNFSKFVTWSDNAFTSKTSPFIIGIYGDDSFERVLEKVLKDRKILNRNWVAIRYDAPEDIERCHILFVSEMSRLELKELFKIIKEKSILTVGNNIEDFCELGGIINFTSKHSKYRFHINNNAAKRKKIIISSKLLALSKIITEDEIKF